MRPQLLQRTGAVEVANAWSWRVGWLTLHTSQVPRRTMATALP